MFADSLLETSWAYRSRRGWTTFTSFGLQSIVIALLLMIPLLTTVGVPLSRTVSTPIGLFRRDPGPAPHVNSERTSAVQIVPYTGRIMAPGRIPRGIPRGDGPPSQSGGPNLDSGIYIGPSIGSGPGLPLPISGTRPLMPVAPPPAAVKREFRTSSMLQGSLIQRVEPVYPPLARSARIQGPVVLTALISRAGTMENVTAVSGHPMLVPAAVRAVSQWRYKPYILNGVAIEVETQITVNFVLEGN
jgi:periplasmic protein TonB